MQSLHLAPVVWSSRRVVTLVFLSGRIPSFPVMSILSKASLSP